MKISNKTMSILGGITLLLVSILVIVLALNGNTAMERDIAPVLITIPMGSILLFLGIFAQNDDYEPTYEDMKTQEERYNYIVNKYNL